MDSTGAEAFNTCLGCSNPGAMTLAQGGVYTLTVGSDREGGAISTASSCGLCRRQFVIAVGETVANGEPGPGAGNIESPGVRDIYTFNAAAGQKILGIVQEQANSVAGVRWELVDVAGATLFSTCLGDTPRVTLAHGGVYTLTVGSDGDKGMGVYRFKFWSVPAPQQFAIAVGDTVANGVPSAGLATSNRPEQRISIRFNAASEPAGEV